MIKEVKMNRIDSTEFEISRALLKYPFVFSASNYFSQAVQADLASVKSGDHEQSADDRQVLKEIDELGLVWKMCMEYQRGRNQIDGND